MGKSLPEKMFCLNCRIVTDVKVNLSDKGLNSLTCKSCDGTQEIHNRR